jgi:hypothetical protein
MINTDPFSGGDKPHPCLFGETFFEMAGIMPACKGQQIEKVAEIKRLYS